MAKYKMIVLTDPVAGKEDEYNEWYTKIHLPDLLKIPGIYAADRSKLVHTEMNGPARQKYCAVYHIETDNLDAVVKDMQSRIGTPDMTLSDALGSETDLQMFEVFSEQ